MRSIIRFLSILVSSNNEFSSKRISSLMLIISGITLPTICIFMEPKGIVDESILILSAQFLAAACGLLGFTLKESKMSTKITTSKPTDSRRTISSRDNDKLGSTNKYEEENLG